MDPNNPQQYIGLGGIYYQLNQWENAQNQFEIAVKLKPDFPNAYYNLGHALEQKQDIKGAVAQYETVKTLVANNNPAALKQITQEINMLTGKEEQPQQSNKEKSKKKSLEVNETNSNLPSLDPKVIIPPPTDATESAK